MSLSRLMHRGHVHCRPPSTGGVMKGRSQRVHVHVNLNGAGVGDIFATVGLRPSSSQPER